MASAMESRWAKSMGMALVVASPSGVAVSHVSEVRGKKSVEVVVGECSLKGNEANFLQHDVAPGVGEHFFFDPVAALHVVFVSS